MKRADLLDINDVLQHPGRIMAVDIDTELANQSDVDLLAPVEGFLEAVSTGNLLLITGEFCTKANMDCARCAEPIETEVTFMIDEQVPVEGVPASYGTQETEIAHIAPDDSVEMFEGNAILVEALLREALLIALPLQPLCEHGWDQPCPLAEARGVAQREAASRESSAASGVRVADIVHGHPEVDDVLSIVLDAMGGDHAPHEIVKGALEAVPHLSMPLILVGQPEVLKPLLASGPGVELVAASECVAMDESPTEAYRVKKDSSIMVGANLVKEGRAKALISAGNTGAVTAACLLKWRQLKGIHRPAIASQMPNRHGLFLLLDAGASPDVDAGDMIEFALMGRAYAEKMMGRRNPRVHLLNIGEEAMKGNALTKQTFRLMERFPWFAGNIEGKGMFFEPCDVVVCDAFVGNVVLKTSEGIAELIVQTIRGGVPRNPVMKLPYLPLRRIMAPLRKQMDYAEVGGSPLLGLNGLCTICHGRSHAKAIKNAILQTEQAIKVDLAGAIGDAVSAATVTPATVGRE